MFERLVLDASDFKPGQKVWFHGLKAKVADEVTYEVLEEGIVASEWDLWAVPIIVKGGNTITIAHVDALIPRQKGEAWI